MSTKKSFRVSVFILFIFMLSGCASSSIHMRKPVSVKLSVYKTLIVDVASNNTRYFSDAENQLENSLISKFREKNLFKEVFLNTSPEGESVDLQLNITIMDLFEVTRSNRIFWASGGYRTSRS